MREDGDGAERQPAGAAADEEGENETEKLLGVSVNRRIGDDEAHLLYWSGFDVVEDSAAAFTDDLRHYAQHVRARGMGSWPRLNTSCQLPAEEGT